MDTLIVTLGPIKQHFVGVIIFQTHLLLTQVSLERVRGTLAGLKTLDRFGVGEETMTASLELVTPQTQPHPFRFQILGSPFLSDIFTLVELKQMIPYGVGESEQTTDLAMVTLTTEIRQLRYLAVEVGNLYLPVSTSPAVLNLTTHCGAGVQVKGLVLEITQEGQRQLKFLAAEVGKWFPLVTSRMLAELSQMIRFGVGGLATLDAPDWGTPTM